MEQFTFTYVSDAGSIVKGAQTKVTDPVTVQQTIEDFFKFLEATGLASETIYDAVYEALQDRFDEMFEVSEEPFELEIVEDEQGYGLGV